MSTRGHGETLSATILFSVNLLRWDENHNRGKDESDQKLQLKRRGNASVTNNSG